ncbi:hypothetical protein [Streptomyces sp. 049-1]|uniref:hypothetical protein n=1 Tax=Streptomyces sp. 049-1 TaxID=2789264 RepID=UPI00397FD369
MEPDEWGPEEWAMEARAVRRALAAVGEIVPECLPGESRYCGTSAQEHHGTWLAMLKARAQIMIEANHEEDMAAHFGESMYQKSLDDGRRYFGLTE